MNGAEESPHVRVIHGGLQRGSRPSVICNSNKHEFRSDVSEATRINRDEEYSDMKMVKHFIGEDLDLDWTQPPSYMSAAPSNVKSLNITPVGKMLKDHYSSIEISNSNSYTCDKMPSSDIHYSSNHSSPKRHKSHHHQSSSSSVISDLESENLQLAMLVTAGDGRGNKRPRKSSESSSSSTSTSVDIGPKVIKSEYPAVFKEKIGNKPMDHCHVCGDLAVAHMHYGGVCCYSCKAFFRRATQTGKDKKYRCKSDKNCTITDTNRRSCQYCRFQKCLSIGMKPNWVLSDEQCNIRFRRVRQEKGADKELKVKQEVQQSSCDLLGNVNQDEVIHIKREQESPVSTNLVMPFTSEELRSVDYMIEYYNLSKETYVFSEENDDLFKRLFQDTPTPEPSNSKYSYSQFDLGGLIMTLMKKNIFFCRSIDQFKSISPEDQVALLRTNMTEMCHLRGAIRYDVKSKNFVWYFSKKDQLQMTFQKSNDSMSGRSAAAAAADSAARTSSNSSFSFQNALIGPQDMSKIYKTTTTQKIFGTVSKLCEIGLPMEVYLILIHIVLFSSDNIEAGDILVNKKEVENIQTNYMLFLHRYLTELFGSNGGRMKLSQIMGCLVELRQLCERSKGEEEQSRIVPKNRTEPGQPGPSYL